MQESSLKTFCVPPYWVDIAITDYHFVQILLFLNRRIRQASIYDVEISF